MLKDKMLRVMNEVNGEVAERTELIRYIAIALLTRKNLFILGGTGQAKSYAVDLFRERIQGTKQFKYTLSKGTDEEQLFGRLDLGSLLPGGVPATVLEEDPSYQNLYQEARVSHQSYESDPNEKNYRSFLEAASRLEQYRHAMGQAGHGRPSIITEGKIPESHIIFLDEAFKANDGLLNALLTALNEREYTNEGVTRKIPAISFFAASNEIPNFSDPAESILRPLYDRFELKIITQYVQDRDTRLAMLAKKQSGTRGAAAAVITLDELQKMQKEVSEVKVPAAVNEVMDDILCELRRKGVSISDRKYFGFTPIVQAEAWLEGRSEVQISDLLTLSAYLWTTPEELPQIAQVLKDVCENPLGERIDNLRAMALECYDAFQKDHRTAGVKALRKFREDMLTIYQQFAALQKEARTDADNRSLEELLAFLEDKNRSAIDTIGFTYVPLSEMAQLPN